MSSKFDWKDNLHNQDHTWLVTGCAGFIGSNLVETLVTSGQKVVGLDNFSTGKQANLSNLKEVVGKAWDNFTFIEGDIREPKDCSKAVKAVDIVLHQAALGSVPRSIKDPQNSLASNVSGFLNMLEACREAGVQRFVYASSSSVYGDAEGLPKKEEVIGKPLSPYALSKRCNEEYADVWNRVYGLSCVGLRYFNVFGARQDPNGPYAAVIPCWVKALVGGAVPKIFGDGETSRDFCYIDNAVQANVRAGLQHDEKLKERVFNVSYGKQTSLNQLYEIIVQELISKGVLKGPVSPEYLDFRPGDIRASLADLSSIKKCLGYDPSMSLEDGLPLALDYYLQNA